MQANLTAEARQALIQLIHYSRLHLKYPQLMTSEGITKALDTLEKEGVTHTCANCLR